ncbi:MAG: tetratricopeptide repeat protein [Patescibacteria group bacterium]
MSSISSRFEHGAKVMLFVLAAALPLWFVPFPGVGIEMGRDISFGVLILISAVLWLLSILSSGEIRYARSPLLWAGGALLAVSALSAFFSKAPLVSLLFADAAAEKFFSVLAMLVLAALASGVLRRREDAGMALLVLIFSGAVSALMTLIQLLGGPSLLNYLKISSAAGANVVGSANGLSLFYAALLAMAAGITLSRAAGNWNARVQWALGAAGALFLADIFLINFATAWQALLGASVFLFGLMTIQNRMSPDTGPPVSSGAPPLPAKANWRYWAGLALAGVSIVMIMFRTPPITGIALPPEVSPSFSATVSIAGSVFKESAARVFFGSGPGTFGLDWARYKDPSLNRTIFWNVGFPQGNSWASTLFATGGVLGAAAFVAFALGGLLIFLRAILSPEISRGSMPPASALAEAGGHLEDPVTMAIFLGNTVAVIAALLYPSNLSLAFILFFTSGLLVFLFSRPAQAAPPAPDVPDDIPPQESNMDFSSGLSLDADQVGLSAEARAKAGFNAPPARGFWEFEERLARFRTPWAVFMSSLAVVFLLALGVAGLYGEVSRMRAAIAVSAGIAKAGRGALDDAVLDLDRAARIEANNFRIRQFLAAVRTEKVRAVIRRAAAGEQVTQEFQSAVSAAVQDLQRAVALHPADPGLWRTQGALYELIIPFVPGAERLAFSSYQKAAELDPSDPSVYVDWGRAGLVFADRIQAAAAAAKDGKERAQLDGARASNLAQIAQVFQKAADLKPDYAPAHFLLAQTHIRLGNLDSAIASVENAKAAAPFDIGIAFQMGLLYYQKQDMDRAAAEFERAISLNENYSNARYFLGLIRDRRGDTKKAIEEFSKIAALNPDNAEVKRILENLNAGLPALDGIVPPLPPPEKRKEAPVREMEQRR